VCGQSDFTRLHQFLSAACRLASLLLGTRRDEPNEAQPNLSRWNGGESLPFNLGMAAVWFQSGDLDTEKRQTNFVNEMYP